VLQTPMIFMTFNAAIFHITTCTLLQFCVINFRFAAGSTHFVGRLYSAHVQYNKFKDANMLILDVPSKNNLHQDVLFQFSEILLWIL
jgi:hypothetical protein